MVIVPNSSIAKNEIINYTYPDPRYRIQTHVSVAYGTDVEVARQVIIDAVRQLEDVLPDKPVDALYNEMGDSAMIFRVRWWIESYADTRRVIDRSASCPRPLRPWISQIRTVDSLFELREMKALISP
jgi:small-conductance mechanosensitive channel